MSLTGNLEDLPLLDILQIVSFSQKTGFLTIQTVEGDGAISFREGLVVNAFTWESGSAESDQSTEDTHTQISSALERLARVSDGQFNFSLTPEPPTRIGDRDITGETLLPGINPQGLLLDLARGLDEDRRDSADALAAGFDEEGAVTGVEPEATVAFEAPVDPEPEDDGTSTLRLPAVMDLDASAEEVSSAVREAEPQRALLLVDDEEGVRSILAQRFAKDGYQVIEAAGPNEALKKSKRLVDGEIPFIVVCDLGMPSSGGSSFQGGFEVVKRLWKMKIRPPVVMMTETVNQAIRARTKQMSISSLVFKPGLSKLDPDQFRQDMVQFADKMAIRLLPRLLAELEASEPTPPRAGGARRVTRTRGAVELAQVLSRLKKLREPSDATQISSLMMEVARDYFERGVLFLMRDEEVRGLGGFGPTSTGRPIGQVVRELAIPLSEPSLFAEVAVSGKSHRGPLPDGRWNEHVITTLGRFRSHDVALFPLVAYRQPLALLFGDNPETGRPVEGLDALEIFVGQAAIALENAFLHRKLESWD